MSSGCVSGRERILVRRLRNGVMLPAVSLGTFRLGAAEAEGAVGAALRCGYAGLDDAWYYKNESEVGRVVQGYDGTVRGPSPSIESCEGCEVVSGDQFLENLNSCPPGLAAGGAGQHGRAADERKVFVTSKIWVTHFARDAMRAQTEEHLENFGRSSCDLMLLHWPGAHPHIVPDEVELKRMAHEMNNDAFRAATWRHLEELYAEGKCRAIGVSNYMLKHLKPLIDDIKKRQAAGDQKAVIPMYNQIEINPTLPPDPELEKLCNEHGILLSSYRTLGGSAKAVAELLGDPTITRLAQKYGKPPANIALRWAMQRGFHIVPKSVHPERIKANFDLFNFKLTDHDMADLNKLAEQQKRFCGNPLEID